MGLCFSDVKALLRARNSGVSFESVLIVGRQSLFLHPSEVKVLKKEAAALGRPSSSLAGFAFGDYADEFLREFVGMQSLTVLDNSDYEGADLIHDLNRPVAQHLWNSFDVVIDAGSLEHIFNFPTAITSLMRMTKVGGKLFITTPANNLCGHGFYQFSPELMFRVFAEPNGFHLERAVLVPARFPSVELTRTRVGYEVTDPARVGRRVDLVSRTPVMMMVEATKTSDETPFAEAAQQSDYVAKWQGGSTARSSAAKQMLRTIYRRLPHSVQARAMGYRQRSRASLANHSFYRRFKL